MQGQQVATVPRLPGIRAHYEKAPKPKEMIVLEGSAHAQAIFETNQGERLMREIRRFLSEPWHPPRRCTRRPLVP